MCKIKYALYFSTISDAKSNKNHFSLLILVQTKKSLYLHYTWFTELYLNVFSHHENTMVLAVQ
jgi:hypothetical protein